MEKVIIQLVKDKTECSEKYFSVKVKTMPEMREGLYLELTHGFKTEEDRAAANAWGANGPALGPLLWVHTTYAQTVGICFVDIDTAKSFGFCATDIMVDIINDCFPYKGMLYGDWSVYYKK